MKKKLKRIAALVLGVAVAVGGSHCDYQFSQRVEALADTTVSGDTHGMIHVDGDKLYDENGKEYVIKSMGMGNKVWDNPTKPVKSYATEESYKELSELGFNGVRYYINVNLFEDKDNNYNYKEDGFEWLSQNIAWADKYDMKVLINMHVPAGGFMNTSSAYLWNPQADNMKRCKELWKEISRRYKDNKAVLGYGLLNEPFMLKGYNDTKYEDSYCLDQYYDYIEELKDAIRSQGDNHILFVERPYGTVYYSDTSGKFTSTASYVWGDTGSFRIINDSNTVYEFHYYEPGALTHTGLDYGSYEPDYVYTDATAIPRGGKVEKKDYYDVATTYDPSSDSWQNIETGLCKNEGNFNYGYWTLRTAGHGENGSILVDDVVVSEYDENGKYVRDVNVYHFSNPKAGFSGWDIDKTGGSHGYDAAEGHFQNGCIKISGLKNGAYRLYKSDMINFVMKTGYSYKVSAYVKFIDCDNTATVNPGIQAKKAERLYPLNKDYLDYYLSIFRQFGIDNNVPMYVGEVGASCTTINSENNAIQWVSDMLDLFEKYHLGFSYHDYHDQNWGLYQNRQEEYCSIDKRNEKLYNLFQKKLVKKQEEETTTKQEETTTKQAETTTKQAETTTKQAETTTKPVETTTKQAETTTKQAETTTKQAETTTKPVETTTKQAETTTKQAETTTKQAETTTKQAETTTKQEETTKKLEIKDVEISGKSGKVSVGDSVTLKASAKGGTGTLKYKFVVKSDKEHTIKNYSTSNKATWKLTKAGTYNIIVSVKDNSGTVVSKELKKFVVNSRLKISSFETSKKSGKAYVNKKITLTVKANGGSGDYTYRFAFKKTGTTKIVYSGEFKSKNTLVWKTLKAGNYILYAYVKDVNTKKVVSKTISSYKVVK